ATIHTLEPYTHTGFPAFQLNSPDVLRAKLFIDELMIFEKNDSMPNLIYLTLPCDHTSGTSPGKPTPRAMVADNDLALGKASMRPARASSGKTRASWWSRTTHGRDSTTWMGTARSRWQLAPIRGGSMSITRTTIRRA